MAKTPTGSEMWLLGCILGAAKHRMKLKEKNIHVSLSSPWRHVWSKGPKLCICYCLALAVKDKVFPLNSLEFKVSEKEICTIIVL